MTALAIDAWGLGDGSQYRGVGTYLRHVVNGLSADAGVQLTALASPSTELPASVSRVEQKTVLPSRWSTWERDVRLPGEITRSGCEVFHSPAQAPPRTSPVPWVQTLHDLTPLVFQHPLLAADERRWRRIGPRLRHASAVICDSRSSAEQGISLLGLDPARVHVVPLAAEPHFTPGPAEPSSESPYLLWVSAWGPHKGLPEAVAVMQRLADSGYPHRLVMAGRQDDAMRRRIHREIGTSAVADRIVVAGWVADLAALYRGADALLVSSRAEGFGLPVLEALACGTPVVSFDNTSLPEVVGKAGLLVPDGDVVALFDAVRRVLDDDVLRDELSAAGPVWAATFSWTRVLEDHLAIYELVAAQPHRPDPRA
jgi:glycosyltransferase involved in cell wall biosynthesis